MTPEGRVIAIDVDESLDLRVHSLFVQACELVAGSESGAIEVNVANTRQVRDSGLAMLMMLGQRAAGLAGGVRLVNCAPELRRWLRARRLDTDLKLA
jgi:hypothetical protein